MTRKKERGQLIVLSGLRGGQEHGDCRAAGAAGQHLFLSVLHHPAARVGEQNGVNYNLSPGRSLSG